MVPYTSGAVYTGKVLYNTGEPTLLVVPSGVTLKGEGLESKGQEPRTQASVFSVIGSDFIVEIAGAAAAVAGSDSDSDSGDSGPAIEEIRPKVLRDNMKWILALALGILALGFIVLYRAQPAGAAKVSASEPARNRDPKGAEAKGKNDRGRR